MWQSSSRHIDQYRPRECPRAPYSPLCVFRMIGQALVQLLSVHIKGLMQDCGISSALTIVHVYCNDVLGCGKTDFTLDDKLKFNSHVQSLCFRASRQINSFKRIAKYLNVERRLTVLKSFILSNFSYCPVTWIFCGKKNCAKLEKLQERALRIVFNDGHASYETLCESANILPLNVYRVRFLGIEVYKCVNGLNPKYLNDMLVIRPNADRLRDSSRAIQPRFSSVGFGFKSFKYFGAKLWNVLPITVKRSDNLFIFKDRLTEWCHANRSLDIFDIC